MRRDEGSVYKTPDGKRWFARLRYTDATGKAREKKRTCPTLAAAKAEIGKLRDEVSDDARDRRTYAELDAWYRKEYVHEAKFVGTRKVSGFRQSLINVNNYLDVALAYFGDRPIDTITFADLRDYKRTVENRPTIHKRQRSVSDVNHFMKRLRRLFAVAVEQGWLASSPFKRGSLIVESHEVERTRTLSAAEEKRLLDACQKWRRHLIPIIIFAVETGCRRGELQQLRWSGVDLKSRVITLDSLTTKTLRTRMVPVTTRLRDVLVELRGDRLTPRGYVFGPSSFKTAFKKACTDAELADVHFHDLRHTAITRMLEAGISPPLVMKISGHTQQKTFLRYVNQSETSVAEIARMLDRHAA